VIARRGLLAGIGRWPRRPAWRPHSPRPPRRGWATSRREPERNLTGFFLDIPELSAKLLQFLAEAMPRLQRVAVLWDADLARTQLKATRLR
jgi:hypothetical protein